MMLRDSKGRLTAWIVASIAFTAAISIIYLLDQISTIWAE